MGEKITVTKDEVYDAMSLDWDEILQIEPVIRRNNVIVAKLIVTDEELTPKIRGHIAAHLSFMTELLRKVSGQ